MYPIMLDLHLKKVVIIGAGKIAYRKICSLLESGANISVVSPDVITDIQQLSDEGKLAILKKEAEPCDYADAFLVIAATNNKEVNKQIAANVTSQQLVNVVDDATLGNFHIPTKLTRGKLTIAVSTSGASPMLAKKIRDELSLQYDHQYEEYLDFLYECRTLIKNSQLDPTSKSQLLKQLVVTDYKESPQKREAFIKNLPS